MATKAAVPATLDALQPADVRDLFGARKDAVALTFALPRALFTLRRCLRKLSRSTMTVQLAED